MNNVPYIAIWTIYGPDHSKLITRVRIGRLGKIAESIAKDLDMKVVPINELTTKVYDQLMKSESWKYHGESNLLVFKEQGGPFKFDLHLRIKTVENILYL